MRVGDIILHSFSFNIANKKFNKWPKAIFTFSPLAYSSPTIFQLNFTLLKEPCINE